ncbi:hypothetical protein CKO09_01710 [Chromatium weissei]|nr:hypothetical protein [Chromatium weissei]
MSDEKEGASYLRLSDDFDQLRYGFDGTDKMKGGLKLVGKSIFNIGKFALTEVLPAAVAFAAKEAEKKR